MTSTPPSGPSRIKRVAANEETTVLTPVPDGTDALDRIPVSRQRLGIAIIAVLTALLITAVYFAIDFRNVSLDWQAQVEEVKGQNYDLGERLAEEQTQVVELQAANDQVTSQLKTAQARVLELADEKAQQGDNVEFYARQIDDLTTALTTAAGVANALDRCIEGQIQLVDYLKNAANYDPLEIAEYEASLKTKCDNAVAANVELQQLIAQ